MYIIGYQNKMTFHPNLLLRCFVTIEAKWCYGQSRL